MTATATATEQSVWTLDASHTAVEFSVKHLMITTVRGRFADIEGRVTMNGATPDTASVDATIQVASIDTRSEQRDTHLRSADFFDAEHFPDMTFKSVAIEGTPTRFTMTGDLTIRGTTRPVTLDVVFEGATKDPWGGQRMGFSASGKIDRRDFGLVYNQALETGGVVVGNEIKIQIEAQVVRAN